MPQVCMYLYLCTHIDIVLHMPHMHTYITDDVDD